MNEEERRRLEARRKRQKMRERQRRKQVLRQKIIIGGTVFLAVIILIFSSVIKANHKKQEAEAAAKAAQEKKEEEEAKRLKKENTLHMVAVGDNLYHDSILEEGKGGEESEDWNFDFLYKNVKADIENADLAAVNQESPFVNNHDEAAGYPEFATPLEGGEALVKAGFDIVTQATNHAFDKGKAGIINSVSFWKNKHSGITLLGIHEDQEDQDTNRIRVREEKNFKIAMMNYTFGLNESAQMSESESYCVDLYEEETVKQDVAKAKTMADVIIVFLHTGTEDVTEVDEETEEKIDFLAEQGVDITICSHPHVVRAFGMKERPDGNNMLVYYSLGNFVSTQEAIPELLEGMADFTLEKNPETGGVTITDYSLVPLVMHYEKDKTNCAVYKFSDYTDEMAKKHGIHEYSQDTFNLESIRGYFEPLLTPRSFKTESQKDNVSSDAETT
ncbi:MAG: CapA family protein [Blautia sp.]